LTFDLNKAQPPVAEIRPVETQHHGRTLVDNYAWLRANNWQDVMRDPSALPQDIRAYLDAENDYQKTILADTEGLQDVLFEEMEGRIKQDDSSVPSPDGPFAYSSRYEEGGEYPLFIRAPRDGGEESVLFDGPKEAEGSDYFALGMMNHSPDHSKLAWSVDQNGSEFHHMRIRNVATGKDSEKLTRDVGSFQWCNDSEGYVYVKVDENHRPNEVWFQPSAGEQQLIYREDDPRFYTVNG